jgi:hypothetical protein
MKLKALQIAIYTAAIAFVPLAGLEVLRLFNPPVIITPIPDHQPIGYFSATEFAPGTIIRRPRLGPERPVKILKVKVTPHEVHTFEISGHRRLSAEAVLSFAKTNCPALNLDDTATLSSKFSLSPMSGVKEVILEDDIREVVTDFVNEFRTGQRKYEIGDRYFYVAETFATTSVRLTSVTALDASFGTGLDNCAKPSNNQKISVSRNAEDQVSLTMEFDVPNRGWFKQVELDVVAPAGAAPNAVPKISLREPGLFSPE